MTKRGRADDLAPGKSVRVVLPDHWANGCEAIVEEVRPWGVVCYVIVDAGPEGNGPRGRAYLRLEHGQIGRWAPWSRGV